MLGSVTYSCGYSQIQKARHAFHNMPAVWSSSYFSLKTKLKLFDDVVTSKLLYSREC